MMNDESIKDVRLMIDAVGKDFMRLSADLKVLSDFLRPIQVGLQIKEEEMKKNEMEHK